MSHAFSVLSRLARTASHGRAADTDRRSSSLTERLAIGLGCGDRTTAR